MFIAVIGVLLVGGSAMAANLGLLTGTTSADRGYRLSVPRPVLSVTLPTTEPEPPNVDTTSVSDNADEPGDTDTGDSVTSTTTEPSPDGASVNHDEDTSHGFEREPDDGNEAEIDGTDPGGDSKAKHRHDNPDRRGGQSEGGAGEIDKDRWSAHDGDGRFDDD